MVPGLVHHMKSDGKNDDSILEMMNQMQNESLVHYGNRSKVGILLDSQNRKLLNFQRLLKAEQLAKKQHLRHASDYNKGQVEELVRFSQKFKSIMAER